MSATTEPKADAPRGQGRIEAALDAFDAAETEQAPAAERQPAPSEQAQTPEPATDGAPTPPRDERGRFTSAQQEAQPRQQAPPAQEQPAPAAQPSPEQPVDKAAQLEARLAELERSYNSNVNQLRTQNQQLQQQLQQGEQTWRQRDEQARATYRKQLNDKLEAQLASSPDLTDREKYLYRQDLKAQFLEEDNARIQAGWDAERQGWTAQLGTTQQQYQRALLPQVLPQVLSTYAGQLAAKAAQHGAQATPEEAAAFLADPAVRQQIEWAWLQPLPPDAKERLVDSIEAQQAWALAERSRLTTERREWEQQRQLAGNRARAAGDGATRELVPGAAGELAPDYSKYRNSGNVAGALDAYEEDRQAGRAT
jgi:hypothetical protein